jgi:hypothetical protein
MVVTIVLTSHLIYDHFTRASLPFTNTMTNKFKQTRIVARKINLFRTDLCLGVCLFMSKIQNKAGIAYVFCLGVLS